MSVSGNRGVGIPIILLHDAEGAIITIEIKGGTSYRGFLDEAQDNMNCTLKVNLFYNFIYILFYFIYLMF
jgi:small nuclear ribonucleoprotein D3